MRVLIKFSGEALSGENQNGINPEVVNSLAKQIKKIKSEHKDAEIAIVVGGGNFWRGTTAEKLGMERANADYIGMLATIMNGLAVQDAFNKEKIKSRTLTSINMPTVAEHYIIDKARKYLATNKVIILAGGTGAPFFTTDSGAVLRASELEIDMILMAKNGVDGVYDKDPATNKDAKLLKELTYNEVVEQKLNVMDMTAITMAEEQGIKLHVFNIDDVDNISKIINGEKIGTIIQ